LFKIKLSTCEKKFIVTHKHWGKVDLCIPCKSMKWPLIFNLTFKKISHHLCEVGCTSKLIYYASGFRVSTLRFTIFNLGWIGMASSFHTCLIGPYVKNTQLKVNLACYTQFKVNLAYLFLNYWNSDKINIEAHEPHFCKINGYSTKKCPLSVIGNQT
jgi:hypothetical protein